MRSTGISPHVTPRIHVPHRRVFSSRFFEIFREKYPGKMKRHHWHSSVHVSRLRKRQGEQWGTHAAQTVTAGCYFPTSEKKTTTSPGF